MATGPLRFDPDCDHSFDDYITPLDEAAAENSLAPLHAVQRKRIRGDDNDQDVSACEPAQKKTKIDRQTRHSNEDRRAPNEDVKFDFSLFVHCTPSKDSVAETARDGQLADTTHQDGTDFKPDPVARVSTPPPYHTPDLQRTTVSPKDLQVVADQSVQIVQLAEPFSQPGIVHPISQSISQWHGHGNQFGEGYDGFPVSGLHPFDQPASAPDLMGPNIMYSYPSPLLANEPITRAGYSHHPAHTSYRAPEPNMGDGQQAARRSSSSTSTSGITNSNPGPRPTSAGSRQRPRRTRSTASSSRGRYASEEEIEARRQRDVFFMYLKDEVGLTYKEIKSQHNFTEAESTLRGRHRALTKASDERRRKPKWSDKDITTLRRLVGEKLATQVGAPSFEKISWKGMQEEMRSAGCYAFGFAALKKKAKELLGSSTDDETDIEAAEVDEGHTGNPANVGSNASNPFVV
ncbi:hypothetical protein Sste5346_009468 [Sporothrix stenoceras]|uniref:Myb-like domain-containing protein n=1 Tax=Sporothrix stenoceras TaxID=5173 RepID=A0ABR3YKC4_9PEZI